MLGRGRSGSDPGVGPLPGKRPLGSSRRIFSERKNNLRSQNPAGGSRSLPPSSPRFFFFLLFFLFFLSFCLSPPPSLWPRAGPGEPLPAARRVGGAAARPAGSGAVRSGAERSEAAGRVGPGRRRAARPRSAVGGARPATAAQRGAVRRAPPGAAPGGAPGEAAGAGRGGEITRLRAASPGLPPLQEKRVEKLVLPSQKLSPCVRMPGVWWEVEGGAGRGGVEIRRRLEGRDRFSLSAAAPGRVCAPAEAGGAGSRGRQSRLPPHRPGHLGTWPRRRSDPPVPAGGAVGRVGSELCPPGPAETLTYPNCSLFFLYFSFLFFFFPLLLFYFTSSNLAQDLLTAASGGAQIGIR